MAVVRGQFDKHLVPGARKTFVDDYTELPHVYTQIFNIDTSKKAYEDDLVSTGLPIAVLKPEGEPIAFDRPKFRGRVRYIHTGYGLGYEITREAVEDELYGVLTSQGSANLSMSMRAAEETTAATVLNNGFTSVTTYDGKNIFATDHTSVGSTTFANRPSTEIDLSVAGLKASMERFFNLKTDRLIKIKMMPKFLLVNHNNWWTAQEVLNTRVVTGASSGGEIATITSAEATNVVTQMGLIPVMWNYITDDDVWITLAPKGVHKLNFIWRRKPDFVSGTDERAGLAWFGVTGRWVAGATDWRGCDGSTGAA